MTRLLTLAIVCAVGWTAGSGSAFAQNTSRVETVKSEDGMGIRFTYYPAMKEKGTPQDAPVAILLHGAGGSRIVWDKGSAPTGGKSFPETLQDAGFAVLTVDLRKHGESVPTGGDAKIFPTDYQAMALGDLVAIKAFLKDEHQKKALNMGKIGIVAADMSCPVAAAFAEYDWKATPYDDAPVLANRTPRGQDVRALVFLSPDSTAGRLKTTASVNFLRAKEFNIAFFGIAGATDAQDKGQTKKLYELFKSGSKGEEGAAADRFFISEPKLKDRGTDLLRKAPAAVETPMFNFLVKYVKEVVLPWQDRRSKLER